MVAVRKAVVAEAVPYLRLSVMQNATWQMFDQRISGKPLPRGLDAVWDSAIGLAGRLKPRRKRFLEQAERILVLEKQFSQMTDAKLSQTARELQEIFRCNRDTPAALERAFALIREVAFRQIMEKPFQVQVAGAIALENGCIAEMATGEGKTLSAVLAVTVAGWRGKGCHVITVNDYLARRDAEWMGSIYRFCGLTVSWIEQMTPHGERRAAYMADITYCTSKEVAADFLRDRLIMGKLKGLSSALIHDLASTGRNITGRILQRGLHCAIVDEADSILIDEAVTPLIISGEAPNPEQVESFRLAAEIAEKLTPSNDYTINHRYREIELTEAGKNRIRELTGNLGGFWKGGRRCHEMINFALTAKEMYLRDKQYILSDDKVVIIDEFTGRLMPDRTWRDGLHQAIEAREGAKVTTPKDTYARISFQRFFRMYKKLSGMTGTASESGGEFWQIYHLPVVAIPTNRPCIRRTLRNIILPDESAKWERIIREIKTIHETGRPVLIGVRSVRASEHLSNLLKEEHLEHQVLNAIYHRQEAQIVAEAGKEGKITVATNMAGRGTDIKLGRGVAEMGGLHVIAAEPNDSGRIDRQLFGRGARQGDPGSAQGIFSLEDEIVTRYAKGVTAYLKTYYNNGRYALPFRGRERVGMGIIRLSQKRAERLALRQRKAVLKTDHWLDEQLGFTGGE